MSENINYTDGRQHILVNISLAFSHNVIKVLVHKKDISELFTLSPNNIKGFEPYILLTVTVCGIFYIVDISVSLFKITNILHISPQHY